jgi:hypothetical protein
MGCHQFNGKSNKGFEPEIPPLCGGWIRAARYTVAVKIALRRNVSRRNGTGQWD